MKLFVADFLPGLYKGIPKDSNGVTTPTSLADLPIIVANVIQILLTVIGALAVLFIMYAGIQYIISSGDPQKTAAAKQGIINAVIGLVLSASAYLILDFLVRSF